MAVVQKSPGVIRADEAYRLDEIMIRLGMGRHALRAARDRGLPVKTCGKRRYVLGSDALAFLAAADNVEEAAT